MPDPAEPASSDQPTDPRGAAAEPGESQLTATSAGAAAEPGESQSAAVAAGAAAAGSAAGPAAAGSTTPTTTPPQSATPVGVPPPGDPYRPASAPRRAQRWWLPRAWPGPAERPALVLTVGTGVVALFAAGTLVGARHGLQLAMLAAAVATLGVTAGRRRPTWRASVPAALAVALATVPAIRDANWLVALCLLAAFGLTALAAVAGTTWSAGFWAVPVLLVATLRGLPWLSRPRGPVEGRGSAGPWLVGLLVGVPVAGVVLALLASADPVFAGLLGDLLPELSVGDVLGRPLTALAFVLLATAAVFLAAAPPRWSPPGSPTRSRTTAGWALPLILTGMVLAAFLAVQGLVLFDREAALAAGDTTLAGWARQGFWQLLAVLAIGVTLFVVAAVRCDPDRPSHRRLLTVVGGGLVGLLVVVVASALTRMWVYQGSFGWSVDRVNVAAVEVWLGLVLVAGFVLWLLRRSRFVPRLVVYSAGCLLLGLAALGPEQFVAEANVRRYQATGDLDVRYLAGLSHDAVPALSRLDEPLRSCALGSRAPAEDPWYAGNLARALAAPVLASHLPTSCDVD